MSNVTINSALAAPSEPTTHEAIRDALMESRQRWRHLVGLAADLAFETDVQGRFVFVMPDAALGWPRGSLLGQSSDLLLDPGRIDPVRNPFCPSVDIRRHRTWLRCADGSQVLMAISAAPLHDVAGQRVGARGIGIDISDADFQEPHVAGRLRRGEVLDQILVRISRETSIDGMMDAALWSLIHALHAQGAAVIGALPAGGPTEILHECGPGASAVLETAARMMLRRGQSEPVQNPDGRQVLTLVCPARFGVNAGLVIWRPAEDRIWSQDDGQLAGAAIGIIRIVLEYEAVQQEMAIQARTDPLTELLNRRAFLDELRRHIGRLDREKAPGTMIFIDLDGFKSVNDRLGHAMGDKILTHIADRLRKLVRPNDLIARLGGDEFAVWLSGVDHMTAAERADLLCTTVPDELQALLPEVVAGIGLSIGIATRNAGSREPVEELMRRADSAMYEVKRGGRGHWRVSLREGD